MLLQSNLAYTDWFKGYKSQCKAENFKVSDPLGIVFEGTWLFHSALRLNEVSCQARMGFKCPLGDMSSTANCSWLQEWEITFSDWSIINSEVRSSDLFEQLTESELRLFNYFSFRYAGWDSYLNFSVTLWNNTICCFYSHTN